MKDIQHAKACKVYLTKMSNTKLGYQNGYHIHLWCNEYLHKLKFDIIDFWVVKKDFRGYKRGQKIMNKSEMQKFVNMGGKVRNISCFDKETRIAMRQLIEYLDIQTPYSHGFTKNRDIFTQFQTLSQYALRNNFLGSVVSLDLSNAFDQITGNQVYAIFRYVFELNKKQAEELSRKCVRNGHLFQGNTLAPMLFNIWFSRFYMIIDKSIQGNHCLITNYADDITIMLEYKTASWKFIKFIIKLIKQIGFQINKSKVKIRNAVNLEATGLQYKNSGTGDWKVYPRNNKKLLNNIRLWEYLKGLGIENTLRQNRKGELITLDEMLNGLKNWFNRVNTFQPV